MTSGSYSLQDPTEHSTPGGGGPPIFYLPSILLAAATSLVVFFPFALVDRHVLRPTIVILGFAIAIVELNRRNERLAVAVVMLTAVTWTPVIYALSQHLKASVGDVSIAFNLQRGLVLLPLFALVGSCIYKASSRNAYLYSYAGFALVSSIFAIAEHFLGRSLFGRAEYFNSVTRDGQIRGLAGAEHVLVLGTLICIAVPLVLSQINKVRLLVAVALLIGCWATGSLGPTATGIMVTAACLIPGVRTWLRNHQTATLWGLGIALAGLAYLSTNVWSTSINDISGRDYSDGYRFALYATLPSILGSNPLGIGIGDLPVGVWQFARSNFEVVDLSRTVDSELVHLGIMFGYLGLALFVALFVIAVRVLRSNFHLGLVLGTTLIVGLVLSLHSWDTLGPIWYAVIGAAVAVWRRDRPDQDVFRPRTTEDSHRAAG